MQLNKENYKMPFIELFKTIYGYYFYDVNKNTILEIGKEEYDLLYQCLKKNEFKLNDQLSELIDNGYLKDERAEFIEHFGIYNIETLLNRKIKKITLQLTQDCNFRCKYCLYTKGKNAHQRGHSKQKMSWEIAKKSIDYVIKHSIDNKIINIGFYGGEPLIEFELIKKCIEYTQRECIGKIFTYTITTNGTLITDKIVEFFLKYNVICVLSLDGPKHINDKNRVFHNGNGTYDVVVQKIQNIKGKYPQFSSKLQLNMVVDPQNSFDELCNIDFDRLGLDENRVNISFVDWADESDNVKISDKFISGYNYGLFLSYLYYMGIIDKDGISPIKLILAKELIDEIEKGHATNRIGKYAAPSGPCIPGQARLFITCKGEMYPCERVSETSEIMKIGNLEVGINCEKAIYLLQVGKVGENICKNCWAFRKCKMCAKLTDDGDKMSAEKKFSHCNEIKERARLQIEVEIMMDEARKRKLSVRR